eukprot:7390924-Prymnesium_polylepis.2
MQLAYLRGYFFSQYLGRGMPDDQSVNSALAILGTSGASVAAAARNAHMRPTLPTAFDLALSGSGAGPLAAIEGGSSPIDLASLNSGSVGTSDFSPSSASGSTMPSSAAGLSRQDVEEIVAAAVAKVSAPLLPADASQEMGDIKCPFCEGRLAKCKGQCRQGRHAFNLRRESDKLSAKKREEADAAKKANGE